MLVGMGTWAGVCVRGDHGQARVCRHLLMRVWVWVGHMASCSVSSPDMPVPPTTAILSATLMGNSWVQHVFKRRGEMVGMGEVSGPQCVATRC